MSKKLYLECCSGISGDMTVAALIDLGADREVLDRALKSLPVDGFSAVISRVVKAGLDACDFAVKLDTVHDNHDHDMEYLHAEGHAHGDDHAHAQDHTHDSHCHTHMHRSLPDILHILDHAQLTPHARELAGRIFAILAKAEAKAHGVPEEEVHFHEVGAVDSIVDITAAAVCLDNLGVTQVIVTELYEGRGTVRCQHGILPVPVPAVADILSEYRIPVHPMEMNGEFVTPTGAAIVAAVRTQEKLPQRFTVLKTGLGAGKRTYERPSLLRAMLIEEADAPESDFIWKLETNIDDCSGEALGYAMERLMEGGALDVHYIPVFMKKNRPAWQLDVLCKDEMLEEMERILFRETTTIGIRRMKMQRSVLNRILRKVTTPYGEVSVKECASPSGPRFYPEYESLVRLCRENGHAYTEMYHLVMSLCCEAVE